MKECLLSPYMNLEKELRYKQESGKPHTMQGSDVAVLKTLAKYGVLNRKNLTNAVSATMPLRWQKPTYERELKTLYADGYIGKYIYASDTENSLTLYALTDAGYQYLRKKESDCQKVKGLLPPSGNRYTTDTALELASLNQWHISVTRTYQDAIVEEYYQYFSYSKEMKGTVIPSIIKLSGRELLFGKSITLLALSAPKKDDGVFLNKLLGVNLFAKENDICENPVIIIVTDTLTSIQETHKLIHQYEAMEGFRCLYALDMDTGKGDALYMLYDCINIKGTGDYRFEPISLLKKGVEV